MGSGAGETFFEFLETSDGCTVRWRRSPALFHVSTLVTAVFAVALFYTPLVAAGIFLAEQVSRAPWQLLLLASLFVLQVGSVGPVPLFLWCLYWACRDLAWKVLLACFGRGDL